MFVLKYRAHNKYIIFVSVQLEWPSLLSGLKTAPLATLQEIYELFTVQYIKPLLPANLQRCCRCQWKCEVR